MFEILKESVSKKESSILDIESLVAWKRSKKAYGFKTLPKIAIITVFGRQRRFGLRYRKKKIEGLKGANFLIRNKEIVLCTGCGYGASHVIGLCEELRILGVSQFIFIGVAGILDPNYNEAELLYVEKAFSGVGTSYYYQSSEEIVADAVPCNEKLIKEAKIKSVIGWSTDAPFRETKTLKDYYMKKGAKIVEMECAAMYAFSNFYGLNTSCYVITSDTLFDEWKPPKNHALLSAKEQYLISKIKEII